LNVLLVLPLVIPQATAVVALLMRRWRAAQRVVSVAGALGLVAACVAIFERVWTSGVQAVQMGGWTAPFGITLVADPLSAGLLLVASVAALIVVLYSLTGIDERREQFEYWPLTFVLLMGVNGAFITGDIFNLYVWFEVLLIASFVLLVLGNEKAQLDGAVKYVGINLVSSTAFLAAIGLLYGATGTLNMADLAGQLEPLRGTGLEATLAALFLVAFGIKAAIFPLFFWLPASYHTPPAPVAALFAGLLTKVGVYSLLRMFTLLFAEPAGYTQTLLLVLAGLTMLVGVLGALVERNLPRLFAFLVVSAMGYILMGLGLYTEGGLTGAIFYTLQDVLVKATLFLVAGLVLKETGEVVLDRVGGLYRYRPLLAGLFIVPAFSLAGFPPFPGFWGKLALVRAGLEAGRPVIVGVALVVGLLTLLVAGQVWSRAFWRDPSSEGEEQQVATPVPALQTGPVALLVAVVFALGIYAQPLYALAERATGALLDSESYIEAVGPERQTDSHAPSDDAGHGDGHSEDSKGH
jgi:multicomponent Na+:H+ antiporter subunit D